MKKILVNIGIRYKKIACTEDGKLLDFYAFDENAESLVDNIYTGKVRDVMKKLEAVFVDIGENKSAYLQIENGASYPASGDKVLVQVAKEETDKKGAYLTRSLTFVGRFVVLLYMPKGNYSKSDILFSNDIDKDEEKELKGMTGDIKVRKDFKVIIRKEAVGVAPGDIKKDYEVLINLYDSINSEHEAESAPKLLYKKSIANLILNEIYNSKVDEIVVDNKKVYDDLLKAFSSYNIDINKLKLYEDKNINIFELNKIDTELKKALGKYVWLKNGAQIYIEHTEAMTVIDVNSSKFEGKKELEESALKINLEAAKEIARQIRVRNISGIIIVDFINMKKAENNERLLKEFKEAVKGDKQKVNVLGMTKLGLVELTRAKKRKMLKDVVKG